MNQKYIYGLIVLVLIAVVGGYLATQRSASPGDQAAVAPSTAGKTLQDLMALGGSQRCTFSYEDSVSKTDGTMYLANGKVRNDMTVIAKVAGNKEDLIHSIVDSGYMYNWTDGESEGMKASLADVGSGIADVGGGTQTLATSYDGDVNYNCTPWTADASLFTPPATVQFTDASAMMQDMMSGTDTSDTNMEGNGDDGAMMPSSSADQCSACDSIPDPSAQAQCRAALQCE
jgi:hypothetical protein